MLSNMLIPSLFFSKCIKIYNVLRKVIQMKYFEVLAKCGHVGRNNFVLKKFYVECHSKKEAAAIIRNTPRVKHNHKDAIREVKEISLEEFSLGKRAMNQDPYFHVQNSSDQRRLCKMLPKEIEKEIKVMNPKKNHKWQRTKYLALEKELQREMRGEFCYE